MEQLIISILVYGTVILTMSVSNRIAYTHSLQSTSDIKVIRVKYIAFSIILYCTMCAIRWGVGRDCQSYMETYYNVNKGYIHDGIDWGYMSLIKLYGTMGFSHIAWFFTLAFLQIGFIYAAFRKNPSILLFIPLLLFIHGDYWSWMNGVRQNLVCCMFVFSLVQWSEKKYLWSILIILLSTLMHRSAWVLFALLPLMLLLKRGVIGRPIQILILGGCFVFMGYNLTDILLPNIEWVILAIGYESGEMAIADVVFEKSFGIRSILTYLCYLIVILYSKQLRECYKSELFNIFYNLFFISICLQLIFFNQAAIERLLYYVIIFQLVILSYCCNYLAHYKAGNRAIKTIALASILVFLLVRTGYEFYVSISDPEQVILYNTCIGKFYGR